MTLSSTFPGAWNLEPQVVAALLPALVCVTYFVVGYAGYLARCAIWGEAVDPEVEARGRSLLLGLHLRHFFIWVSRPIWVVLLASGVRPTTVTAAAVLLGLSAGGAVAAGHFALGGWLFLFSGALDAMDGRLARARKQVSPAGAAIDSVLDRYVDSAMLMGLAWYYRDSWVLVPVLFALLGTSVVPYVRAKAEALGVTMTGGMMQRAERVLYLGGAVTISSILEALTLGGGRAPQHLVAILGVIFLAVSSNLTALGRFRTLVVSLETAGLPADKGQDRQDRHDRHDRQDRQDRHEQMVGACSIGGGVVHGTSSRG